MRLGETEESVGSRSVQQRLYEREVGHAAVSTGNVGQSSLTLSTSWIRKCLLSSSGSHTLPGRPLISRASLRLLVSCSNSRSDSLFSAGDVIPLVSGLRASGGDVGRATVTVEGDASGVVKLGSEDDPVGSRCVDTEPCRGRKMDEAVELALSRDEGVNPATNMRG
jgi:hypothetical protein